MVDAPWLSPGENKTLGHFLFLGIIYSLSPVTCHLSPVTCHLSPHFPTHLSREKPRQVKDVYGDTATLNQLIPKLCQ